MCAEKIRTLSLAFAIFLIAQAVVPASDIAEGFKQELGLNMSQGADFHGIRTDNPLNDRNWQKQPEWESKMEAGLDWYVGFSDRVQLSVSGDMQWPEGAGEYGEENRDMRDDVSFFLDEALFGFDLYECGLRLVAGKTVVRQGPSVLFPVTDFLVKETKKNDGENHGKWITGVSFQKDSAVAEAWFFPAKSWFKDDYAPTYENGDSDPMVLLHAAYSLDVQRFGILYFHNGANTVGAYYSGQINDGLIPYAEVAVSDHPLVRSFADERVFSASDDWSADAMCGMSYAPSFIDLTMYIEYRYRSSGYSSDDWSEIDDNLSALRSLLPYDYSYYDACGSIASSLPYFDTSIHSFGIRFQNSKLIADMFDYGVNAFLLAPDGLYVSGEIVMSTIDRLKISIGVTELMSLEDRGEMAWWNDEWQIKLVARWTARTFE